MPTSQAYLDSAIPYGGRIVSVKSGGGAGSAIGSYKAESITINRPTKTVERPDEVGGPNGFAVVNAQETGSCVLQIDAGAECPKNGYWFSETFDLKSGASAETWVINSVGQPFEMQGYFKVNCNLIRAHNPPTA